MNKAILKKSDEQLRVIHTEIEMPSGRHNVGIDLFCTEQHLIDHQGTGYVYEPDVMAAILNFIKPGDVCIDAGANLGYHTILMAKLAGGSGKVLAFECDPDCLEKLSNNLTLNGVTDTCYIIPIALWECSGILEFYTAKCGYGSVLQFKNLTQVKMDVKACALDDAINSDFPVRMLKIDCEGAEEKVLHGAEKLLRRGVDAIIVEFNYNIFDRLCVTDKPIREYMNSLGYELYFLFGNGIFPERIALDTIIQRSESRFHFNGLFCKEEVLKETWKLSTVGDTTVWPIPDIERKEHNG